MERIEKRQGSCAAFEFKLLLILRYNGEAIRECLEHAQQTDEFRVRRKPRLPQSSLLV